jgi:hypothetical protein
VWLRFTSWRISPITIADVRDPGGTVRSRLHRGRKMLQKALWCLAEESGIVTELTQREGDA